MAGTTQTTGRVQVTAQGKAMAVQRFRGGQPRGEITTLSSGASAIPDKFISRVGFQEMSWELGIAHSQPWLDWANSFLGNIHPRVNGEVAHANSGGEVGSYMDFRDALMTSLTFPPLDASSKEPAFLKFHVRPETVLRRKGDGAKLPSAPRQKAFLQSNFRVKIGNLPTAKVKAVESMSWKMKVAEIFNGSERLPTVAPSATEQPILKLTIGAADVQPWLDWADDFLIQGHSSNDDELTGSIEYLAPDKTVAATLTLAHVGILELDIQQDVAKDAVATFTATLYMESAKFTMP